MSELQRQQLEYTKLRQDVCKVFKQVQQGQAGRCESATHVIEMVIQFVDQNRGE